MKADLADHFRNHRIHLARHDRRAGLHGGQADFIKPTARAGGKPAKVVADFGKLHGSGLHRAAHQGKRAAVLGGLHQIFRDSNSQAADVAEVHGAELGISRRAVDAGADGGGSHVDIEKLLRSALDVADAIFDHRGVGTEFLAQRHRHGILIFRAAHFQHVGEFLRLFDKCVSQFPQGGGGVTHRENDTQLDRGRVGVVRRLGTVHVVVRVKEFVLPFAVAKDL